MFTEGMCERVSVTVESRHKQPWRNTFTDVMSNLKSNVHMYTLLRLIVVGGEGALVSLLAQLFSLLCGNKNTFQHSSGMRTNHCSGRHWMSVPV